MAQYEGRGPLLSQGGRTRRGALALRQHAFAADDRGNCCCRGPMVEREPGGPSAVVGPAAFLCLFGGLWFGADLHPALVAALLVQHAVWDGDAARFCALLRDAGWLDIGLDEEEN